MKKVFIVIISLFMFVSYVNATKIELIYSEWVDYYPEGIEEIRIESQDRYKWFKMENGNRIETEEYYDYVEGYEKIEESKKTYYRVINNEVLLLDVWGNIVLDDLNCRKEFCTKVRLKPFIPEQPQEEVTTTTTKPHEEVIINPDTYDPLYLYCSLFVASIIIVVIINHRNVKKII